MNVMNVHPRLLNLEITTRCSARCIMCPHERLVRRNRDMSFDNIMKIMDEAYTMGVRDIHPHFFGEPTMHPMYSEILYSIRRKYPDVHLVNYTNGYRLCDNRVAQAMLDTLDKVVVSIDGATNETMTKIRQGLDPNMIRNGVKSLYGNRKGNKPYIIIRMTKMPENEHELYDYRKIWGLYCDEVFITYLQDFHGFRELPVRKRYNMPCDRIFYAIAVTVNKNVVLCCDDYNEDIVLGNLDDKPLKDIWYSEKAQKIRELHLNGKSQQIQICAKCSWRGYKKNSFFFKSNKYIKRAYLSGQCIIYFYV